MSSRRALLLQWAEEGVIPRDRLRDALALAGVTPTATQWRVFLDRALLWSGVLMLAASVIFFIAYNWDALGRWARFALVEILIVLALAAHWKLGSERPAGKAALVAASILLGALLALFGQTYQTGADTWQLFAMWAALVFPWVLIGRQAALWVLWLALVNVAAVLYFQIFRGALWLAFGTEAMLLMLLALNTSALALWELAARHFDWLRERWAMRLLVVAAGSAVTVLLLQLIFDAHGTSHAPVLIYPIWIAAAYVVYRWLVPDLFVLAGLCLSLIVVVTSFLGGYVLKNQSAGAFLFIALVVIAMSAGAAIWLRAVGRALRA